MLQVNRQIAGLVKARPSSKSKLKITVPTEAIFKIAKKTIPWQLES
jgi:hypothetical protein